MLELKVFSHYKLSKKSNFHEIVPIKCVIRRSQTKLTFCSNIGYQNPKRNKTNHNNYQSQLTAVLLAVSSSFQRTTF